MIALTNRPPRSTHEGSKTAYLSVHTTREIKDLVREAAAIKGCSMSKLILDSRIEQARRVESLQREPYP